MQSYPRETHLSQKKKFIRTSVFYYQVTFYKKLKLWDVECFIEEFEKMIMMMGECQRTTIYHFWYIALTFCFIRNSYNCQDHKVKHDSEDKVVIRNIFPFTLKGSLVFIIHIVHHCWQTNALVQARAMNPIVDLMILCDIVLI